jgi:hypothetical protein
MPQGPPICKNQEYSGSRNRSFRERDYAYAYASVRAKLPKRSRHLERGYDVATHFAEVIATRYRREEQLDLDATFRSQVDLWKDETAHLSSLTKAIAHPSYLRIIGLARYSSNGEIERLLLRELEADPDHWFAALSAVTGEDPVEPEHDFDEAVGAWLAWGREKGFIN